MMSGSYIEKNKRVLIIDDNPSIHEDFRKILMPDDDLAELAEAAEAFFGESDVFSDELGVQLEFARQGKDGVERCAHAIQRGRPFALAFVDMRMPPGWDGLRTICELWKIDPNLQVVICSAYSDHSWSGIRRKLGNSDQLLILKKPYDNAEVLQMTSALIEKRHLSEKARFRAEELEAAVRDRTRHMNEAKQDAQLLISSIGSVLIWLNEKGEVKHWNQRSEELFGIFSDAAIGRKFDELPIDWEDMTSINLLMSTESSRVDAEFFDATGNRRVVGMTGYNVADKRFQRGILILGAELTEQRLRESQALQTQKLEAVGQLAAGVAHEINTPMQYIGDNLDYLGKALAALEPTIDALTQLSSAGSNAESERAAIMNVRAAAEELKGRKLLDNLMEAITDSRGGVQHVTKIVRAMKEFAHPGQEDKIIVDINKALDSTIAVSTNEWKYIADIETSYDESDPKVTAFAVELNQVFLNILVNAAHAVGEATDEGARGKGKITVSTESLHDSVRIAITDSGTGIPNHVKARIFDPFFTTKEVGKGTGQGLSIAYAVVVQKHGGRLWCESTSGEGTTFYIEIPFSTDIRAHVESPEATSDAPLLTTV
jgi:signal transduction histidine kinase/DNA-binding NarL/FixJ family response regulator